MPFRYIYYGVFSPHYNKWTMTIPLLDPRHSLTYCYACLESAYFKGFSRYNAFRLEHTPLQKNTHVIVRQGPKHNLAPIQRIGMGQWVTHITGVNTQLFFQGLPRLRMALIGRGATLHHRERRTLPPVTKGAQRINTKTLKPPPLQYRAHTVFSSSATHGWDDYLAT